MKTAVLCNSKIDGGGEQSAKWIADHLRAKMYSLSTDDWKNCVEEKQIWYMNNSIYMLMNKVDEFKAVLDKAKEIYIVLNFVLGGMQRCDWLAHYPLRKILFLNEEKRDEWHNKSHCSLVPIPTVALPPPVNVYKYMSNERDYKKDKLIIGRHSRISLKYPPKPYEMYEKLLEQLPEAEFHFQIAHRDIVRRFKGHPKFKFFAYNEKPVVKFLEDIDIYLSIINPNTKDQGPRTLIEAMASGLPCVVENRNGQRERMINGVTGYLVNTQDEAIEAVSLLYNSAYLRREMGENARVRAINFNPYYWIKELGCNIYGN